MNIPETPIEDFNELLVDSLCKLDHATLEALYKAAERCLPQLTTRLARMFADATFSAIEEAEEITGTDEREER